MTNTCVFPSHFVDQLDQETELSSLDALPPQIQTRLQQYLTTRLGSDFLARLRFRAASFMDPAKVPGVVEEQQQLGRVYVAYVVLFDLPLSDGSNYCAGVHMAADGSVVMGIGLPTIARFPKKTYVLTLSEAEGVAEEHGVSNPNQALSRLEYAPDRDALVWGIAEVTPDTGKRTMVRTNYIDAHTGQFLGWGDGEIRF